MSTVYKTRLGTFKVRGDCHVGITVYRAGRTVTIGRSLKQPGDLFAVGHFKPAVMDQKPLPNLFGGTFVSRFRPDGTEVKHADVIRDIPPPREIPPQEVCENDTMSC